MRQSADGQSLPLAPASSAMPEAPQGAVGPFGSQIMVIWVFSMVPMEGLGQSAPFSVAVTGRSDVVG